MTTVMRRGRNHVVVLKDKTLYTLEYGRLMDACNGVDNNGEYCDTKDTKVFRYLRYSEKHHHSLCQKNFLHDTPRLSVVGLLQIKD